MSRIVVVTGTDTGVGKTVVTAALAVVAAAQGSVAVAKPVQTGVDAARVPVDGAEPADVDEVQRLAGCPVVEFARLADPLAPETAARLRSVRVPTVAHHADRIRAVAQAHDAVLVEGAGGLLVRLDGEGGTVLDLAHLLGAEVVVVCRAGLGTLNHAELTVAALRAREIEPAGVVIGAWPRDPDLAQRCNRGDLPRLTGVPLLGVVPAGAAALSREEFGAAAPGWLGLP